MNRQSQKRVEGVKKKWKEREESRRSGRGQKEVGGVRKKWEKSEEIGRNQEK